MAPTKNTRNAVTKQSTALTTLIPSDGGAVATRKALTRRVVVENIQDQNMEIIQTRGKRKAENSPVKNEKIKRSALSNLTNNVKMTLNMGGGDDDAKKHIALKKKDINIYTQTQTQTQVLEDKKTTNKNNTHNNIHGHLHHQTQTKIMTRAAAAARNAIIKPLKDAKSKITSDAYGNILDTAPVSKLKKEELVAPAAPLAANVAAAVIKMPNKPARRISNEFNKTEDSLYMSALEDVSSCENSRLSGNFEANKRRSILLNRVKTEMAEAAKTVNEEKTLETPPAGVDDFDKLNWNDPFQVSCYAIDIFNYLKFREAEFVIDDYMPRQINLSKWMRSLLVDWMVEVQETFELNHETLYLAVKVVDIFLSRIIINKDKLQLLGAAALFIACKFDERTPPLVEDFLYICDGAYKHNELIKMEMDVLRTIDFDLGIPLSYRFLRRYARCGRVPLPTLTLARYILELSLMDYATTSLSDSRLACAALFMAMRMHGKQQPWSMTFEYYTGYNVLEFALIVPILNAVLHRKPKGSIKTILSKYSHKIFHEVAKVPLMTTQKLLEQNLPAKELQKVLQEEIANAIPATL